MPSSSPSRVPYIPPPQVPIKVQHKIAKQTKRTTIRRKRIDLRCGCSYFLSIDCHNHGFSHRGEYHCSSVNEWRLYLRRTESPIFQNFIPPQQTIPDGTRHSSGPSQIQPQPQEGVGDSEVFSELQDLHSFTTSDIAFLKSI
uniref:Transcriptional activator protein n=1 Tax=Ocimum yellow vein virus TaxID=2664942 RepID=A0A5Q0TS19_9GEMI|nr:transactivator protein [Ocimum yellow vein virus]